MNRRIGILGGLAALLPLAAEGKKARVAALSSCACPLTFASYGADFTPGGEDVALITANGVVATLPNPADNAGREYRIVLGDQRNLLITQFDGTLLSGTGGVFVCDGALWYVVALY